MPVLLGLICLIVFNANLRQIGTGDTLPARYLPLSIWRYGTLELDQIARWVAHGHSSVKPWDRPNATAGQVIYLEPWSYWITRSRHDHLVSVYPVVTPLLVAPLYIPVIGHLRRHGWEQPYVDRVAELMEKLSASLIAAVATVLVYCLLRRDGGRWALGLALAFAFGTNTWMISSQALWQHGAGQLLIATALLLVVSAPTPIRAAALGAVCVAIAANRPPDALLAGAIVLYVLWTRRRSAQWFFVGAALPLAALLIYNLRMVGSLAGGYGMTDTLPSEYFGHPVWSGLAGLLISPTRGLLVFSPFLMFVPFGLTMRLREPRTRGLALALGVGVIAQLLLYSRTDWRAGAAWGPRWLTDMLPILIWMLSPALLVLRPVTRCVLIMTIVVSIGVQSIGAFWYTKTSDDVICADRASMSAAWDLRNTPFFAELRHPPARGELLCDTVSWIDRIGERLRPVPGEPLPLLEPNNVVEGWAFVCGRTPAELILLIDGIAIGSTKNFLPRPDVNAARHTDSPSGWSLRADLAGVQPGERLLQIAVRVEPRSDIRIVREQPVIVVRQEALREPETTASASAADAMARRATSLVRDRQDPEGYWLTSYTAEPRFETPRSEMNTFLSSMMVDLLSSIARQHDLEDVVQRARRHLGAQIETDGLVRYHGLPNGPTIGPLGCVITPDADDTALAWRIAGAAVDPRRQRMLNELARYRDARGLYRTWLAPRERYECLDPGRDPDPVDATIQMHVYLMLREFDPPAALSLCSALQHAIGDENLWVYYAHAPLVPFLRCAELQQQGCAVPLPTDRLARSVAGQEIWSEAVRRLVGTMTSPPSGNERQAMVDLLARIGRDDFAELRRTPPLLYHNDLTATVPRYYWSEDFGYALWLRLYDAVLGNPGRSGSTPQ